MSVTDQKSYVEYAGNNSTSTAYAITFAFQSSADLEVYVDGVAYTTFTVTGSNLTTTTAIATTATVRIERAQSLDQTLTLTPSGDLPSASMNTQLDKAILLLQQIKDLNDRSLMVSRGSTQNVVPDLAATTSHGIWMDGSGNPVPYTAAQFAAALLPELNLGTTTPDKSTATTADAASRALLAPAFSGQLLIQLDDGSLWRGTGTSAGNWADIGTAYQTVADDAARTAATPAFVGQLLNQTRGGSWYIATGTSAGNWAWLTYGDFTPAAAATWAASTAYSKGDLLKVANTVESTGNTAQAGAATTIQLAASETFADDELIGMRVRILTGTGAEQIRIITDYVSSTDTATVDFNWKVVPDATSTYEILSYPELSTGTAQAGTSTTIQLAASETYTDDQINGARVFITGGTGAGQWREVIDYVGSTDTATVNTWSTTPDNTSTYAVQWIGGNVIYEVMVDSFTSATQFPFDLATGDVATYLVEDYHYSRRGAHNDTQTRHVQLGPASRADDWSKIVDEVYQLFPTPGGGPGITTKWGADYIRWGTIEFTEGIYDFGTTLKHVPLCNLMGPHYYSSQSMRIRAAETWDGSTYLIDGARRDGTDCNSNFHTGIKNVFIDAADRAVVAVRVCASQGSEWSNIEIDRFRVAGIVIDKGCDNVSIRNIDMAMLIDENLTSDFGWFFHQDAIKAIKIDRCNITRCEVGVSLGNSHAVTFDTPEFENCGLPIEFRLKNHTGLFGTDSDNTGSPSGCSFNGMWAKRDSGDTFTTSTRTLARIRVQQETNYGCIITGKCSDTAANLPYDRVEIQYNNSGTEEDFPLRYRWELDRTDKSDISFPPFRTDDFPNDSTDANTRNRHLREDHVKVSGNTAYMLAANSPAAAITADGNTDLTLQPGWYEISLLATNTYGGGTCSINQGTTSTAIHDFFDGYGTDSTELVGMYMHPGGQVRITVAGSTTPSIWVEFRPIKIPV